MLRFYIVSNVLTCSLHDITEAPLVHPEKEIKGGGGGGLIDRIPK